MNEGTRAGRRGGHEQHDRAPAHEQVRVGQGVIVEAGIEERDSPADHRDRMRHPPVEGRRVARDGIHEERGEGEGEGVEREHVLEAPWTRGRRCYPARPGGSRA